MPSKVLNFDSAFSSYLYDANNTSGLLYSPYYSEYKIAQTIRNIQRLKLIAVEIPLLFNNVRSSTIPYTSLNYLAFNYTYSQTTSETTTATTNATTFTITATNSNILIGETVFGNNITNSPTVTNINGTNITLSSQQSIPAGTTLTFAMIGTYSTNITENIYNNVSSLLTVINTIISSDATLISRGLTAVFSVSPTNKMVITTNASFFQLLNSGVSYNYPNTVYPFMNKILGFDNSSATNGTLTAVNRYNLNIDNYLNMIIVNVPSMNQNANNLICSFKIPLNSVNGTIYYHFNNSTYEQYIENSDVNFILDKFSIKILDRFGNSINPNGSDYSFTLNIDYHSW